jgi:hypothetical protein
MNSFHFRSTFDASLVNSGPDALLERSQFKILVVLDDPRLDLVSRLGVLGFRNSR